MDIATIRDWITSHLDGVHVVEANGDLFFMDAPESKMPFATIVTSNAHDAASDLDRPGAYRVNVGVTRETYEARFGPPPPGPIGVDPVDTGHDYTRRDALMPHPIYAPLAWLCVVEPSDTTFASLTPLLDEAHAIASGRSGRRAFDLEGTYRHVSRNVDEVLRSETCTCFFCGESFPPSAIFDWSADDPLTAICPFCGVDTVIGSASGIEMTPALIAAMRRRYFGGYFGDTA